MKIVNLGQVHHNTIVINHSNNCLHDNMLRNLVV